MLYFTGRRHFLATNKMIKRAIANKDFNSASDILENLPGRIDMLVKNQPADKVLHEFKIINYDMAFFAK